MINLIPCDGVIVYIIKYYGHSTFMQFDVKIVAKYTSLYHYIKIVLILWCMSTHYGTYLKKYGIGERLFLCSIYMFYTFGGGTLGFFDEEFIELFLVDQILLVPLITICYLESMHTNV